MLIQKAFKEIAKGIYSQQEVRRDLVSQGLKVSKNRFSRLLRDPLYLGKIKVTAFKDEPVHYVEGIHEGLIEAELFYKVQDVLNNKRPKFPPVYKRDAMLPLRGHLLCNTCGGNLTGSKSKGNGGKYYYYHCQKGCKVRYKADQLNDEFETLLGSMKVEKEVVDVFYEIVKSQLKGTDGKANKIAKIEDKIKKEEARICKLQDLMLDGDISNAEYNNMKKRYEESINHLSIEKIDVQSFDDTFQEYLNFGLSIVENIDIYYNEGDEKTKQKIIGSIFPEKLVYDENDYRTNRVNELVKLLTSDTSSFMESKKGQTPVVKNLSPLVGREGLEPNLNLIEGLMLLAKIPLYNIL